MSASGLLDTPAFRILQTANPDKVGSLTIRSAEKNDGTFNDFGFSFGVPTWFKTTRVLLCELHIPMTWYVFNTANNTIQFIEQANPSTTLVGTIAPGNYDTIPNSLPNFLTLQQAVSNALNNAPGATLTYTVTFNYNNGLLTIASTGNFKLLFSASNDPSGPLGFPNVDTAFASSFTGAQPIKITPSGCIYIDIDGLGIPRQLTSIKAVTSGTFGFCVEALSNENWKFQNNGTYPMYGSTGVNGTLRVKVINAATGALLPLLNDWTMTLQLSDV